LTLAYLLICLLLATSVPLLAIHVVAPMASDQVTGQVRIAGADFNPFTLELELHAVAVTDDLERPILEVQRIHADAQLATLWQGRPVLKSLHLDRPFIHLDVDEQGVLSLRRLLPEDLGEETTHFDPAEQAPLFVEDLRITSGTVRFTDRSGDVPLEKQFGIEGRLAPLATGADAEPTVGRVSARTADGEGVTTEFTLQGGSGAVELDGQIERIDLTFFTPYIQRALPVWVHRGDVEGEFALHWDPRPDRRVGRVEFSGQIAGLDVGGQGDSPRGHVDGGVDVELDWLERRIDIQPRDARVHSLSVDLLPESEPAETQPPRLAEPTPPPLRLDPDDPLRLYTVPPEWVARRTTQTLQRLHAFAVDALPGRQSEMPLWVTALRHDVTQLDGPWRIDVGPARVAIRDIHLLDQAAPGGEQKLGLIRGELTTEATSLEKRFQSLIALDLELLTGGTLTWRGIARPMETEPAVSMQAELRDVDLTVATPYLEPFVAINLARGEFNATIASQLAVAPDGRIQASVQGDLAVEAMRVEEASRDTATPPATQPHRALDNPLLAFERFTVSGIDAKLGRDVSRVDEIAILGLRGRGVLLEDRSPEVLTLVRIPLNSDPPGEGPNQKSDAGGEPPSALQKLAGGPLVTLPDWAPILELGRFRLRGEAVTVVDRGVPGDFQETISEIDVEVLPVSTRPGTVSRVVATLTIGGQARVETDGEVELFNPFHRTLVEVRYDDPSLSRYNPYIDEVIGYHLSEGQVNVAVPVEIREGELFSRIAPSIPLFSLGSRTGNPSRLGHLPIEPAISLMKTRSGELKAPPVEIRGDLSDPSFSLGRILASALTNNVKRIVTAPFSFLASALNLKADQLERVMMQPGLARPSDAGLRSIESLTVVLRERPKLDIRLIGRVDRERDTRAIKQAVALERAREAFNAGQLDTFDPATGERRDDDASLYRAWIRQQYLDRFAPAPAAAPESSAGPRRPAPDARPDRPGPVASPTPPTSGPPIDRSPPSPAPTLAPATPRQTDADRPAPTSSESERASAESEPTPDGFTPFQLDWQKPEPGPDAPAESATNSEAALESSPATTAPAPSAERSSGHRPDADAPAESEAPGEPDDAIATTTPSAATQPAAPTTDTASASAATQPAATQPADGAATASVTEDQRRELEAALDQPAEAVDGEEEATGNADTPAPTDASLSFRDMEQAVLDEIPVTRAQLVELARRRAIEAKRRITLSGVVDDDRVSVRDAKDEQLFEPGAVVTVEVD